MIKIFHLLKDVIKLVFRHPITGTTIIPVLSDGRIVLVKRRDTGLWSLPGGIIDWGENVVNAVTRELLEETGLELVSIMRLVGVYSSPDRDPRMHSICISIEAKVKGNFKIEDTLEITDVKAFEREAIPLGNLSHDHDRQLKDYFQGGTILA
ncbi:MAG: NUDIX domain-containing protein [Prochloraceae cyanobacterium]|nr:NUDIX domain-containing protein [Prochloraceae cyanobacterium]